MAFSVFRPAPFFCQSPGDCPGVRGRKGADRGCRRDTAAARCAGAGDIYRIL
nr:MAG TPA: hypothetical protein [Caudoviricetes sp.]